LAATGNHETGGRLEWVQYETPAAEYNNHKHETDEIDAGRFAVVKAVLWRGT